MDINLRDLYIEILKYNNIIQECESGSHGVIWVRFVNKAFAGRFFFGLTPVRKQYE